MDAYKVHIRKIPEKLYIACKLHCENVQAKRLGITRQIGELIDLILVP